MPVEEAKLSEAAMGFMRELRRRDDELYVGLASVCGSRVARRAVELVRELERILNELLGRLGFDGVRVAMSLGGLTSMELADGVKLPAYMGGKEPIAVLFHSPLSTVFHEVCHHLVVDRCLGGDHELSTRVYGKALSKVGPGRHPEELLCNAFGDAAEKQLSKKVPDLVKEYYEAVDALDEATSFAFNGYCDKFWPSAERAAQHLRRLSGMLGVLRGMEFDADALCRELAHGYKGIGIDIEEERRRLEEERKKRSRESRPS